MIRRSRIVALNLAAAASAFAVLAAVALATAQTVPLEPLSGVSPAQFASILQDIGYRAEIVTNTDGKQRIRTRIGGWNALVYFYGCSNLNHDCRSLAVAASWEEIKDSQFANEWNKTRRFSRVYVNADNRPTIEHDILVRHGITRANIRAHLEIFEDQLKELAEQLRRPTASAPVRGQPAPDAPPAGSGHPLWGTWEYHSSLTCTDVLELRPDGTYLWSSANQRIEYTYRVTPRPDTKGFYVLTQTITSVVPGVNCRGNVTAARARPGTQKTWYLRFKSPNEVWWCDEPSDDECGITVSRSSGTHPGRSPR